MSNQFVFYGSDKCHFCDLSKELIESNGDEIERYYNVAEDVEAKNHLISNGFRTIPQIYVKKNDSYEHIGGFVELRQKYNDGEI